MKLSLGSSTHGRRRARALSGIIALALLVGVAACGDDGADPGGAPTTATDGAVSTLLGPDEYAQYLEDNPDVPLVNVHVPYEGHIEGTDAFVPFDEILDWDGLPSDHSAPLAIYCRSGNMSQTAAEALSAAGYTDVVDLRGGMAAWEAAGFELVDQEPTG